MDFSKLDRLRQVKIDRPCPENWDAMDGDQQTRFCAGCGFHVHNVAEMSAEDAEGLFNKPERVCARLTIDEDQNVLTRNGWIPRMVLAGAIAATVTGCAPKPVTTAIVPKQVESLNTPKPVESSHPAAPTDPDAFPDVADTHWAYAPQPSVFEVIEEKIEEIIEEVKEMISPGSRPATVFMGFVSDRYVPSSGSTGSHVSGD